MRSDFEHVSEKLKELERQLQELRHRVARLEALEDGSPALSQEAPESPDGVAAAHVSSRESVFLTSGIALAGRTLVVLGGAYLLRALTEHAVVPARAGVGAALVYAVFWLWRCERSAARGQRTSALFHGHTGALIAYPLLWETAAVFELLPPAAASAALVGILALAWAVAVRHHLTPLAWTVGVAHLGTAFALMFGIQAFVPASLALLAGAAMAELPPLAERWGALRWPSALGADAGSAVLVGVGLTRFAKAGEPVDGAVMPALLALPLVYGVGVVDRTLRRGRALSAFDVLQLAAALALGLGGSARLLAVQGASTVPVAALAVLLGAAAYAVAFAFIDRRQGRGPSFYAFTSFAGVLVLAGTALALGTGSTALVGCWAVLSLVALLLGARFDRITLRFHGVVYIWAAALASGLVTAAVDGLLAEPAAWHALAGTALLVGAMAVAATVLLFATRPEDAAWYTRLPQEGLAVLLAGVVAGFATRGLAPPAMDRFAETDAPAVLAALRSILVAGLALSVAGAVRLWAFPELRWLVYGLLGAGAAKLLWEDLRVDEPVAIFAALAAYGGALIGTSRLLRSGPSPRDA